MNIYRVIAIAFLLIYACSSSQDNSNKPQEKVDRMALEFRDITQIAALRKLTDHEKDMAPFFNKKGDRIFFSRLITPSPADSDNIYQDASEQYLSLDYKNNKLYLLDGIPAPPQKVIIPGDSLPPMYIDKPLMGIQASKALFFCALNNSRKGYTNIYKMLDDSLTQITYGLEASFLELISPDEQYLVFYYGNKFNRLVILNLRYNLFYEIPKPKDEAWKYDFSPHFSPDSKRLVFLRSGSQYKKVNIPFGNIWLIEFKEND